MMSMASLLSTNNSDIAPLEDFDEEDIEGNLLLNYFLICMHLYVCIRKDIHRYTYYTLFIIFLDSSFKQDMNNVSFMTNKIELLTNSLSDPEIIESSVGRLFILMVL